MLTDPDGVRHEWKAVLLDELGQEWWDEDERYVDAAWERVTQLHGV